MVWRVHRSACSVAVLVLCLITSSRVWGQQPPQSGEGERPPVVQQQQQQPPQIEAPPLPLGPAPMSSYPLELLGLLGPKRGGVTVTPSIFISEEYNDNIASDNRDRQWDFITTIGPAIGLVINRPTYQLTAGYSNSSQIYARNSQFDQLLATHNFAGTGLYQATPSLTLTASDSLTYDRNGVVAGFTTGRTESLSNNFNVGATWQMSARDTLNVNGGYTLLRFPGDSGAAESDGYDFRTSYSRAFTALFSGRISYKFDYLDVHGAEDSTTHTPTIGFGYRFTPTLVMSVDGGATITRIGNETFVGPAGLALISKTFSFGSASLQYARDVSVAGGFGGPTDLQTISATLTVTTLVRNLVFLVNPSYSISDSLSSRQSEQVDVQSFTLVIGAAYQFNPYTSLIAGYSFFRQRTGSSSTRQVDVDQNIVRVGLQFGYPFHFD